MSDPYTYGEFFVEGWTFEMNGGSVPGTRHLSVTITEADRADPRFLAAQAYFWELRRRPEPMAASGFTPI